jgi:predicted Zn-dependent protease
MKSPVSGRVTALVLAVIAAAAVGGCVKNPATHQRHARLLSPEAEKKIGEQTKKQILEQYHVIGSTQVSAYVGRVGQRLAQVSDRPTVDYDFTVLDSDLINAFAAPGGFVFVTRGLLDAVNDESELAMVLGHEIAHVAAMHGVQMIQKEMGQNALTILGTIGAALVAGPEAMLMVANSASLFSSLYLLGYSRDKELEADNLGLQYLLRAGYDPAASLRFLQQLQKMGDDEARGWDLYFRTHPQTSERISLIKRLIGEESENRAETNPAEFQEIKALLPRVDERERGRIAGTSYINKFHGLSLAVPSNWSLGFMHPQALVSFQVTNGDGEGRLQVVAVSSITSTPETLAHRFTKDAGFQELNGREVLYQAGYGFLGRYAGVSPAGKLLDIRLFATVRKGRGYIIMAGVEPEKADSYALDLEQIVRSLRFDDDGMRAVAGGTGR